MSFNPFKKLKLATQLYLLVAITLVLAGGLIAHAMMQVRATQGTLKFTIDNRMGSGRDIRNVIDALELAEQKVTAVVEREETPAQAAAAIRAEIADAQAGWDNYFLARMIPEEQALADETTPLLDAAYLRIDRLVSRLEAGQVDGLVRWTREELHPAIAAARANLLQLSDMQMKAANMDLEANKEAYVAALRESILMLTVGGMIALAVAFMIIRSALARLGADPAAAVAVARRIASGDLTFEIDGKQGGPDSLMGALRQMKASLLHSKLDYEGQLKGIARLQGVIETTPTGEIIWANDIYLKLLGYTLEEVKGRHYSMFVDKEIAEAEIFRQFWQSMQKGEVRQNDYRKRCKDGSHVWVNAIFNPVCDASGKPFKVVGYLSDITRQRETALLNAAFRGALDQLDANVMVADNERRIIYANPAARRLMTNLQEHFRKDLPGFDASQLMGMSLDNLTRNPAALAADLEGLSGITTRQEVIGGRTMKSIVSPMKDENGRRLGTVVEWYDRTQEVEDLARQAQVRELEKATEAELQKIIVAVTDGDLSNRISLEGKRGFFEVLSRQINELVDTIAVALNEVQGIVSAANEGDLTRRIQTENRAGLLVKLGNGINELTENMARLVSQVKRAAEEVSRGADEISQGNANLSQRTEAQASSLEETASSMEEMTSTVKHNADNAAQANQLAVEARERAAKGGEVVAKAVQAMTEINQSSKKIADIIGVIDEIAFQTNLLALNAAVEAARAGEQGRGFAVVASEVRNLASRSATAAKEIKALIQDSVRKVDEGSTLVTQSGSTLEQIVASVKRVSDIVAEIAAASGEQSAGIEQVNRAVMQLDELTQQNAALVEEASAASLSMAEQARQLNAAMQKYKVDQRLMAEALAAARPTAEQVAAVTARERERERRRPGRPWSNAPAATAATPAAATGTDDTIWKEF
jgi:methyl-accepting chemotaxis protein|nr:MAG: PAS domain S-box protein [Pseudomonadota bacterium]